MTFRTSTQRGFTLLESVVAISLLMLGVLGPMLLAKQNLKASRSASDRLVASFLAQEGIEMVRNTIANNSADNLTWTDGLTTGAGNPSCDTRPCIVDISLPSSSAFSACSPVGGPNQCGNNSPIYKDANGVLRQSQPSPGAGWTQTQFSRKILFQVVAGDAKRASTTAIVTWPGGSVVLQEDIYNWFFQLN